MRCKHDHLCREYNRLTEDPNVIVGVIEAGDWDPNVAEINVPGKCLSILWINGLQRWVKECVVVLWGIPNTTGHSCRYRKLQPMAAMCFSLGKLRCISAVKLMLSLSGRS
jgi:hypothetical protein